MATFLIRNLSKSLVDRLKAQAASAGRTLEQEAKRILKAAADEPIPPRPRKPTRQERATLLKRLEQFRASIAGKVKRNKGLTKAIDDCSPIARSTAKKTIRPIAAKATTQPDKPKG
jgi:plasmid stability protein